MPRYPSARMSHGSGTPTAIFVRRSSRYCMQHCGREQSKASEETSLAKTGQSAYRIVHGSTRGLADVENFLLTLSGSRDAHALFDQENDIFVGRAPGRLDVMGGIA